MIWNKQEEDYLRKNWEFTPKQTILDRFPQRTWNSISQRARKLDLKRLRMRDTACYKQIYGDWFSWVEKPDGYIVICGYKIGPPKYRKYEHRYIWEYNHGIIPESHEIHHIDGNRQNNAIENLECVHQSEHHSRDREIRKSMTDFLKEKGLYNEWYRREHEGDKSI